MHPRLLLLGTGIDVPVVSRVQAQKGQSGFKLQLHAHASPEFQTCYEFHRSSGYCHGPGICQELELEAFGTAWVMNVCNSCCNAVESDATSTLGGAMLSAKFTFLGQLSPPFWGARPA